MRRALLLAATSCLALLAAARARGGEDEPGFYASGRWQDAQAGASRAAVVLVAKVTEAGKPAGGGWDGNTDGATMACKVDVRQDVTVEVEELLAGEAGSGPLAVKFGESMLGMQAVQQFWIAQIQKKKGNYGNRRLGVENFALVSGRRYLLFLEAPKPAAGGKDGKGRAAAAHLKDCAPVENPDAQILASVRGFCRELAVWKSPPKLTADEEKAVLQLVADLGADGFDKREAAEKALRTSGARLRPYLLKASQDRDEERSFRAKALLKALEPEPGKNELPGGADARVPALMKERPKEPPPKEPDAPDAPRPPVEGGG